MSENFIHVVQLGRVVHVRIPQIHHNDPNRDVEVPAYTADMAS